MTVLVYATLSIPSPSRYPRSDPPSLRRTQHTLSHITAITRIYFITRTSANNRSARPNHRIDSTTLSLSFCCRVVSNIAISVGLFPLCFYCLPCPVCYEIVRCLQVAYIVPSLAPVASPALIIPTYVFANDNLRRLDVLGESYSDSCVVS